MSDKYKKALAEISKKLTPDPTTSQVDFVDIVQFINTHQDDPAVNRFLTKSGIHQSQLKEDRAKALVEFDPNGLEVRQETIWLIDIELSGLSNEERIDDTGTIDYGDDDGDSRHVEEFTGLPTSKQIEDFVKISMACPISCFEPFIPGTLAFSYNLASHKRSLGPFLDTLPWSCNAIFEIAKIRDRMHTSDEIKVNLKYREYIDTCTKVKNAGNNAYARKDRSEALKQYQEAIRQLDKLLMKKITEEEARDKETTVLLAVCWANSSAARMLDGSDKSGSGAPDVEGAKQDVKKAILTDPTYAKGYLRLARAEEALRNIRGALDVLARGLRHNTLQDHVGPADNLISLQTAGNGFPNDKDEFEKLLRVIFKGDAVSAERMKGVGGGVSKRRCKEHMQKLGMI